MTSHAAGVPAELLARSVRLIRPRDARGVYKRPSEEFARLADRGLLRRVATGYFVIVPNDRISEPSWRPSLIATAWAIGAVDYGIDAVAVCGPSAARHHALIPRELATAFVGVPVQRPRLELSDGAARYVRRDVKSVDLERWTSELGQGWVTTLEQTVLDLATLPNRWDVSESDLRDVLRAARARTDRALLERLARAQRRTTALSRMADLER
jgi:predicted transcriptional regulator of viral defense system